MYNPQELRNRAQATIQGVDNEAKTSLNNGSVKPKEKDYFFGERTLATLGHVVNDVLIGATRSLEGIVDAGIMLAGLFGADVDKAVEYDFTGDIFGVDEEGEGYLATGWGRAIESSSIMKEDGFTSQALEGVGGMLPTVLLAILTGGGSTVAQAAGTAGKVAKTAEAAAKTAKVVKAVQTGAFFAQAVGKTSQEALQQGAEYEQALGYGILSGIIESGTEVLGGRVFGEATNMNNSLIGKLLTRKGKTGIVTNKFGKLAFSMLSEGTEEAISELINPGIKRLTGVDKNARVNLKDVAQSFLIGGTVGVVLDEIQNTATALTNKKVGGRNYVDMVENLETIQNSNAAFAVIQGSQKYSQDQVNKASVNNAKVNLKAFENMSRDLTAMSENQRKEALEILKQYSPSIADVFDSNGKLQQDVIDIFDEVIGNKVGKNVSANATHNMPKITEALDLANSEKGYTFELSETNFNEAQRTNFAKVSNAITSFGEKAGVELNLAIINANDNANAFIKDGVIFVSEDKLQDGEWAESVAHEVTHFAENTEEFKHFAEFVTEDQNAVNKAIERMVKADYNLTEKDIRYALKKVMAGEKLNKQESLAYSELVAHITEDLLGNEESIKRLTKGNPSLVEKILAKIKDLISALKGTNANKKTMTRLERAEELFEKVLSSYAEERAEFEKAQARVVKTQKQYAKDKKKYDSLPESKRAKWLEENGYKAEDFAKDVLDDGTEIEEDSTESDNEVDNSNEIRYSYKARDPKTVTEKEFKHHYWAVANNLLSKEEIGVLNSAVGNISRGEVYNKNSDGFFMIPVGEKGIFNKIIFTDGKKGSYSIDSIIEIACDNETDLTDIRGVIYAGEKHGIHTENSELFKIYYGKDYRYNDFITKLQNSSQDSNGEQDGARSSRKIKFSLKDSDGNELSPEQQEYFKNSKVVDKDGNLLVVYHGSPSKFTEFSHSFMNTNGNAHGRGFYFTEDINYADGFKKDGGQLLKGYLNIQKPISETEVTISRANLIKLIKATCEAQAKEFIDEESYDNIEDALLDTWVSNYVDTYSAYSMDYVYRSVADSVLNSCENDADILAELTNGGAGTSRVLTLARKTIGYDGVIFDNGDGTHQFISFESNQFKSADNVKPTKKQDIRFSLKDGKSRTLTDGQVKKKLADYRKAKVYSLSESETAINNIVDNINIDGYNINVFAKDKKRIADELWQGLNTVNYRQRLTLADKIAEYIIDSSTAESVFAMEENAEQSKVIDTLKNYFHLFDLSNIREKIKSQYGNDNSVYLLWGKRKGESGYTADQIAMDIEEQGIYLKSQNEADIFFEIVSKYKEAQRTIKSSYEKLKNVATNEEISEIKADISKQVLDAFKGGEKSKFSKIIENIQKRHKAINSLLYEVNKLKGLKEFKNATQYHSEQFKGSIEQLAKIDWRGNYNESGTRAIVSKLDGWYNDKNEVVKQRFDADISEMLSAIARGDGKLNSAEIQALANIVKYFRHFIETETKIFKAGKYVEAKPLVVDYVEKIQESQNVKVSWATKMFDKVFNNDEASYVQAFADPMSVARYMDKYQDGFYSQTMQEWREGVMNAAILEMEINETINGFYDENKKYKKELAKRKINYKGKEMALDQAISYYLTLNREDALLGLARSGFVYLDGKKNRVRVEGFAQDEDLTIDDIKPIAEEIQKSLKEQFTETDLKYISIVESIYEKCKDLKQNRDMSMKGFSNVIDGYYYPIRRATISKDIDKDSAFFGNDRVSNLSFNKQTVKGAKQELFIDGVSEVTSRHVSGIAKYYHLAHIVENYNIIYNMDISGNANKPVSIATESFNDWKNGRKYFEDMLSDIQGIKKDGGIGSGFAAKLRGSLAKYQLGLNPKVWVTQFSSFFASLNILDFTSLARSVGIKSDDVDVYCKLAKLRNSENSVAYAQGVLDKLDTVSDALMKPIGMTDRFVIKRLFAACQVQVQKDSGLKVGTEENKVKAGELLTKVILETQQNSLATERSAAMRSPNELAKAVTMFTSDAMKVAGRVMDAYGEIAILKARIRAETDTTVKEELQQQLKKAKKKAFKASSSLMLSATFMAVVTQAFKHLYGKHEEDEELAENMKVDIIGNLLGGLPLFKDLYAKVAEGYDFEGMVFSSINDLFTAFGEVLDFAGEVKGGTADSRDWLSTLKKLAYSIGQITGIPIRNVYNVVFGLIKRVSPETAYKIDDAFYKQSYSADLKKAIENNDDEMIETIAGLLMDENIGSFKNSTTRKEINRLVALDLNVLPTSIGKSMTIDDVEYKLSEKDQKAFKKVYSGAIDAVDKLVASKGYQISSDEAKAKAINYVYRYYYYEAQSKTLDIELDTKLYLFGQLIPIETMALALAEVSSIPVGAKNKKATVQRYIQSLKLKAEQKYMLMGYFGYKNTKGESAVMSAISKSSLTEAQKTLLFSKCGY